MCVWIHWNQHIDYPNLLLVIFMILFLLLFVCFLSRFLLLLLLLVLPAMAFILLILPKRQKKYFFVYGCACVSESAGCILYCECICIYLFAHTKEVTAASDNLFIWNLLYLIWLSMVAFLREASLYGGMIEIPSPFLHIYFWYILFSFSCSFSFWLVSFCIFLMNRFYIYCGCCCCCSVLNHFVGILFCSVLL